MSNLSPGPESCSGLGKSAYTGKKLIKEFNGFSQKCFFFHQHSFIKININEKLKTLQKRQRFFCCCVF